MADGQRSDHRATCGAKPHGRRGDLVAVAPAPYRVGGSLARGDVGRVTQAAAFPQPADIESYRNSSKGCS